jgi:Holliday junction resolvasome RuvABC endonuclease subunit
MRHAGAKQIAFMVQKDLGFIDQAAKRGGMHDAVAVALKHISRRCFGLCKTPAATL